mgnify:CR=1 FL=1
MKFSVSHLRDARFAPAGLRSFFEYRDLGIKDATGGAALAGPAARPTRMKEHEIEKMLIDSRKPEDQPTVKLVFHKGENVRIKEGPFEGYEGTVDELFPEKGMVRVLVTIFGRQAPIEIEEWQLGRSDEA